MNKQSYRLVGIWINALSISDLNALIAEAVSSNQRWIIANHNFHSIHIYHQDAKMRAFYALADYIHADSMPLVFLAKLLGYPFQREHRVTYADWTPSLIEEAAQQNWRVFYLGSKPGVAQRGSKILQQKFPNLQIATADGYFDTRPDSQENKNLLAQINNFQPHVLMVGMSMPRQEHWVLDNIDGLSTNAILTAGAAMDYIAGEVPTPPRWAGRWGLEWLSRLIAEPNRLWHRYLVEPWFVLALFIIERFKKGN